MRPPAGSLLGSAILGSLDGLLQALELEPTGDDRFRAASAPGQFPDRIFGGQLLAQALTAASATVTGKVAHSLHAAFVEAGDPGRGVDLVVDRSRDGRSFSTRRVTVVQRGRPLLEAVASFRTNADGPVADGPVAAGPVADEPVAAVGGPEELPLLQHWAQERPDGRRERGRSWIERPPAVEIRMAEAPTFLGGLPASGTRSHWMRLPREVGDDPALHAALLAYASDFLLMDIVFRAHPDKAALGRFGGFSLDHALWLHRPSRFDRWHVHTQEALTITGDRGLAKGMIYDATGQLIASVVQDVLVRPLTTS
jgi:acyl-CoA thioesterase-2